LKKENVFGNLSTGETTKLYNIQNKNGMTLYVTNYGATVTKLIIPTNQGGTDVVLGFDRVEDYEKSYELPNAPYFGTIVGRVAGRIANANFFLNGKKYVVTQNHGKHHLHGGKNGFGQKLWEVKQWDVNLITLHYQSSHLEEGYPGNLNVLVTYEILENNTWKVSLEAWCDEDTIINLTQHAYFKLDDKATDLGEHLIKIFAIEMLEANEEMIPTGTFISTKESNFDFSNFQKVPKSIDTTFVNQKNKLEVAVLQSLSNGLQMKVYTNQPGTHVYVGGNCFNQIVGKNDIKYHSYSGICFETQGFPDAIHHANFPSILLKKGTRYQHETYFKFENI
jgi:aldose 1-epimerase